MELTARLVRRDPTVTRAGTRVLLEGKTQHLDSQRAERELGPTFRARWTRPITDEAAWYRRHGTLPIPARARLQRGTHQSWRRLRNRCPFGRMSFSPEQTVGACPSQTNRFREPTMEPARRTPLRGHRTRRAPVTRLTRDPAHTARNPRPLARRRRPRRLARSRQARATGQPTAVRLPHIN